MSRWLSRLSAFAIVKQDVLSEQAKAQFKCEITFLAHNDRLPETNLGWHRQVESVLWQPQVKETKFSQTED